MRTPYRNALLVAAVLIGLGAASQALAGNPYQGQFQGQSQLQATAGQHVYHHNYNYNVNRNVNVNVNRNYNTNVNANATVTRYYYPSRVYVTRPRVRYRPVWYVY